MIKIYVFHGSNSNNEPSWLEIFGKMHLIFIFTLKKSILDDHLKNDEFQITRREFIDAHIEELIILQKFEDARKASLTLKKTL